MLGNNSNQNITTVLFFANLPDFDELCTISLFVTNITTQVNGSSRHQAQILKCRELIFTETEIIATPSFSDEDSITLIMPKSLYKTGRLQSRFQKIGLQASKPELVTPALFQACLRYTLLAKLAPSWNKAGDWLLQGRDFLTSSSTINAIKMSVCVSSSDICMALKATAVRVPALHLEKLDVCRPIYQEFLRQQTDTITESSLMNTWCHVLPSMKKGQIISVSRVIPEDSPFKTYRDFKRHWKNTYGYRLPETEEDILYYQVYFKPIGSRLFTYPEVCLRSRDFHFLPRIDPKSILVSFLQDTKGKMPTVCGQVMRFQPKAKFPVLKLSTPSQDLTQANLTNKIPWSRVNNRDPQTIHEVHMNPLSGHATTHQEEQLRANSHSRFLPLNQGYSVEQENTNQGMGSLTFKDPPPTSHPGPSIVSASGKVIPIFKSKACHQPKSTLHDGTICSSQTVKRVAPVFQPKKIRCRENLTISIFDDRTQAATARCQNDTDYGDFCLQETQVLVPIPENTVNAITTQGTRPLFERKIGRPGFLPQKSDYPAATFPSKQSSKSINPLHQMTSLFDIGNEAEDDFQILPCPQPTRPAISFSREMLSDLSHLTAAKRKAEQSTDLTVAKKPRSKPQVQENLDVEVLARHGKLSKANATTLLSWLREQGVPCKAKDKKTDLIEKVNSFCKLSGSEQ